MVSVVAKSLHHPDFIKLKRVSLTDDIFPRRHVFDALASSDAPGRGLRGASSRGKRVCPGLQQPLDAISFDTRDCCL